LICSNSFKGFHDCAGGCNGCINFNNPDNAGLLPAVTTLSGLYYQVPILKTAWA
jgi:hypothetical protein